MLSAVLHHVSLEVAPDDVERTVAFLGVLGFERIPAPDSIAPFVTWLEAGATQIHLIHTPEPTRPALGHPAVVARDFDAAIRGLRDAGFEVEDADELWGERRSFAVMPGGQRVEVMAAPPASVRYAVEKFTPDEEALLRPHFTNLDRPVFCLVNLPETVKGALFARYSRYPGTLRRLFLDEFASDVPVGDRPFDGVEGERAAGLYERVFMGYGDDSIAQVGGAHLACEWVSNVMTKVLQRGRLAAYLEQSTRYIPYDQPLPGGGYRYYADDELGPEYRAAMNELFAIYSRSLESVQAWA